MPSYIEQVRQVTSADGSTIFARAIGDPNLPAIVFVHGFGLSSVAYNTTFSDPKWLDRAYLVRYDLRGHGRSTIGETVEFFESKRQAEDFAAVVAAFELKKVYFAGWSLGGSVLVDLYSHIDMPPLLGAIYIAGIPWGSIIPDVTDAAVLGDAVTLTNPKSDGETIVKALQVLLKSLVADPTKLPYEIGAMLTGEMALMTPATLLLSMTRAQDPTTFLEKAGPSLPLLALYGTEDRRISGSKVVDILRPTFGPRLVVHAMERLGHTLFIEAPDEFREKVLAFVKK